MIRLSVNINKIATLRNARGGDTPNVVESAKNLESFGAQGITVHPRPDERHIRYADVNELTKVIKTEFNIEGNPNQKFIALVLDAKPAQVTLVPDGEDVLTSNAGWDTIKHKDFLKEVISEFKAHGIRTSVFVDPSLQMIQGAAEVGADRVELFTEAYAQGYIKDKEKAIAPYLKCAEEAKSLGLGINAGHDLSLENIEYFAQTIPFLDEVSIGHALISEALYDGLEVVVKSYLKKLS
ncbi:pyridoxine 5'-phosphate synthase PdxJ [Psychroflexus torquis ATCC 700755]|uniref:Pyridoxine 5'-phosphate synthase n=1 Tax=Psychroflexus torquis (strain ATCC 700755 / CIP 106069 / ACAM 623) TaxID=313595 RepID=K4IDA0_PSYTT|nr:pyridoxine 5'-phosphate synthase [Psychroflexus torquis]AFU68537.1 pyridoxine 5'-phosphate synthase PdxJ [Psychroflexus torquis ATCC 700755]